MSDADLDDTEEHEYPDGDYNHDTDCNCPNCGDMLQIRERETYYDGEDYGVVCSGCSKRFVVYAKVPDVVFERPEPLANDEEASNP